MFEERRKHVRVMWVSPGAIVLASGSERPCVVSDLSNGGAKLIELSEDVPDEFMLKLCPKRGPARACRVVWRGNRQAGAVAARRTGPRMARSAARQRRQWTLRHHWGGRA